MTDFYDTMLAGLSAVQAQINALVTAIKPKPSVTKAIQVPVPAAGANWSLTIPPGVLWRLKTVVFQYVSDANAGVRFHVLNFQDYTGQFVLVVPASATVPASGQTWAFSWGYGLTTVNQLGNPSTLAFQSMGLPDITMDPDHISIISCISTGIMTGDQYSKIWLVVEETVKPT